MKLKADKYFILSNKRRKDVHVLTPNESLEQSTYYHFETEKPLYEIDQNGNRIQLFDANGDPFPSFFEIWEQIDSEPPAIKKSFNTISKIKGALKLSLSQWVFPGEILTIKLTDLGFGYNPCIPMPHILEDKCKEIKVYGIEKESDFGLNVDTGAEHIGGTFYRINSIFSEKQVSYSIIGYSVFKDLQISPFLTSLEILSMVQNDNHFQFVGSHFATSHPFLLDKINGNHPLGDKLLPGNKYTVLMVTCDQKGRWQLFQRDFVTKKRQATIEILEVRSEFVGDTDGVGDATSINSIILPQNLNTGISIGLFPTINWNNNHRSNDILTLNPTFYKVVIPFRKYEFNSNVVLYTWGREGNGLDKDGYAWSYLNDLDWPPQPNYIPDDNGIISNYFTTGEKEDDAAFRNVVAVNRQDQTSFVYHLKIRMTCRYQ